MGFTLGYIALFILACFLVSQSLWFILPGVALYLYVGHKRNVAACRRRNAFERAQDEEDQRRADERWRNMTEKERQLERESNERAKESQRELDEKAEEERQLQRRLNETAEEILREQDETIPTS
jgi:hypothetical protein